MDNLKKRDLSLQLGNNAWFREGIDEMIQQYQTNVDRVDLGNHVEMVKQVQTIRTLKIVREYLLSPGTKQLETGE